MRFVTFALITAAALALLTISGWLLLIAGQHPDADVQRVRDACEARGGQMHSDGDTLVCRP